MLFLTGLREDSGAILRDGRLIMELTSQFLYRDAYRDHENMF